MRNLIYIPIIALAFLLTACAGGMTPTQQVTLACNGYAATLNSLAAYNMAGKLSEAQIATVDQWEPLLTSACLGGISDDVANSILDQIDAAMWELIEIERNAQ